MPAIAAITLNDSVPVAHTFGPVNIDKEGIASWADRVGGIALGYPIITLSNRVPTAKTRSYKVTLKVVTPVLEVTSPSTGTGIQPAPTKAYDLIYNCEIVLPERSTLLERKNLLAYARNMLANAVFITPAVESFESVY
jgi:hypothetical protein